MRQLCIAVLASAALLSARTTHTTVRHHREEVVDESAAKLTQAQEAIERRDFSAARDLLTKYTALEPDDYRGWYTLAYSESALKNRDAALSDYKRAIQLKPDLFEANLNLGLLLAQSGQREAAIAYLQNATREDAAGGNKAKASAWAALGALQSGDAAKHSYEQALALNPENVEAKHALASSSANAVPTQPASGEELARRLSQDPRDANAAALLAQSYMDRREWAQAEPLLKQVVLAEPTDAHARFRYGICLEHLLRNQEAQDELLKAVQLDPKLADAYGDLAVVAAANKNYALSIKALDYRAKYLPENSGSYFLRATNLDHLQQAKPAALMYRKFLDVAKGESPDNEWQAKHRLVALDPHNQTLGKER